MDDRAIPSIILLNHMKKIIHTLRKQPDDVKHHILHVATAICAVILVALWVYSLGLKNDNAEVVRDEENLKPLTILKANLVDGYQSISE